MTTLMLKPWSATFDCWLRTVTASLAMDLALQREVLLKKPSPTLLGPAVANVHRNSVTWSVSLYKASKIRPQPFGRTWSRSRTPTDSTKKSSPGSWTAETKIPKIWKARRFYQKRYSQTLKPKQLIITLLKLICSDLAKISSVWVSPRFWLSTWK